MPLDTADRRANRPGAVIVGAGLMGRWHAAYLRKAGVSVVAICDPDGLNAYRLAREHRGAKIFPALDLCLDSVGECTAVHVCTPVGEHRAATILALEKKLHVLCEKPITTHVDETGELLELAARHRRMLCPVHQYVFQDGVERAVERLPDIGELLDLEFNFISAGTHGSAASELNRVAADILPHPLSIARRILQQDLPRDGWHVSLTAPGEFHALGRAGCCALRMRISMSGRPPLAEFTVTGTQGAIRGDLFHGYSVNERGSTSRRAKIVRPLSTSVRRFSAATANLMARAVRGEPAYPGLPSLIRRFYAAAAGKGGVPFAPEEIMNVARLRDRLMAEAGLA